MDRLMHPTSRRAKDTALPIDPVLPELQRCLAQGHALLSAPTGSGKTTRVPLALLKANWLRERSILMLEPRRPAARMAAARMATLLDERVGETVGYQVRFERQMGPGTRIEVLTEGILTRRIQHDPELRGCGLLIFDEFHARSLHADLGLALALDVASLREDLRILVMSATLETERLAALLDDAPVIRGDGRAYPVALHYLERSERDPLSAMLPALHRALRDHRGDILAFLPGAGEIQRLAAQLTTHVSNRPTNTGATNLALSERDSAILSPARNPCNQASSPEILPLYGRLSMAEQDRALSPRAGCRRRILLATDIAETSLTVEGIEVVIDSGLARQPRFEPSTGLTRLVTQPISRAAAEQRAGRAGRLGPGHCYRLWSQAQQQARPAQREAEILQADLTSLVLELALWGVTDPAQLRWLNPPPSAAWAQAVDRLQALDALDTQGSITATGRHLATLPLHPRLARMLMAAAAAIPEASTDPAPKQAPPATRPDKRPSPVRRGATGSAQTLATRARGLACDLAALLEERDPWQPRPGRRRPVDLQPCIDALEHARRGQPTPDFEPTRLRTVQRAAQQLRRLMARLDLEREQVQSQEPRFDTDQGPGQHQDRRQARVQALKQKQESPQRRLQLTSEWRNQPASLGAILALAYPDRVARRREHRGNPQAGTGYLLRNGSGAELPPDDALAIEPWLVIANLDAGSGDHRIRTAAAISEIEVRAQFAKQIKTSRTLSWDAQREAVVAREEVRLGAILLESQPAALEPSDDRLAVLLSAIASDLERALHWTPAARQLCARVQLARRLQPEADWPDFSITGLSAGLSAEQDRGPEPWLTPWLAGKSRLAEVRALDLVEVLRQQLGWDRAQALDTLAPTHQRTPAGTNRPIDYLGEQPVLRAPLQELFGVRFTPSIFQGRQPLLLHLLSPAGRPLQVTQDLATFWSGAYAQVRKEMRGRYPKHHWPEDPRREPPLRGGLKPHAQ